MEVLMFALSHSIIAACPQKQNAVKKPKTEKDRRSTGNG
jgi:hypothetical protein